MDRGDWKTRPPRRRGRMARLVPLLTAVALGLAALPGRAAELVMFESPACGWCKRWHAEIGPIYPKTAESRVAPLRRVDLHERWPADLRDLRAVSFTPTFVLIHGGVEVARITGYAGEDFFWFQLGEALKALPADPDAAADAAAGVPDGG